MNQKNIVRSLTLFITVALLVSCSGTIRKLEPEKTPLYVAKAQVTDSRGNSVGKELAPREKYRMNIELVNFGRQTLPAGKIQLQSLQPEVQMKKSTAQIPAIAPRQRSFLRSPVEFSATKVLAPAAVSFNGRGVFGAASDFKFNLGEALNPQVSSDSVSIEDVIINDPPPGGNGDGRLNPGETVNVFIRLRNLGSSFIDTSRAIISTLQLGVDVLDSSFTCPPMPPGVIVTSLDPVRLFVAPTYIQPSVPLKATFVKGIQGIKFFNMAFLLNDIIVCVERISITRGSCRISGGRNPDILTIRLSICNETANTLSNVVAQILKNNIRLCGANLMLCPGNQCPGINDQRVYFGTIDLNNRCAQAKTPCTYNNGADSVAYPLEFKYEINSLPAAAQQVCLIFGLELFYDNNIKDCAVKPGANPNWNRSICASTYMDAAPSCRPGGE